MVTDLRLVLRDAVADAPPDEVDLAAVIGAGARRVRRRRVATGVVAACVAGTLAIVAVVTAQAGKDRAGEQPRPARPVQLGRPLELRDAVLVQPAPVATTRTLQLDPANDLDYDRFDGLTTDGKVVRARYTHQGDVSEFGLVDPTTGVTDWLPRPPWDLGEPQPLSFTADRLLYLDNRKAWADAILAFDRKSRTWTRHAIGLPVEPAQHFGMVAKLGPDDRIYLHGVLFDQPQGGWWSVPAGTGGVPRPEPELDGKQPAWNGRVLATADPSGVVEVSTGDVRRVVASAPPAGCGTPRDPNAVPDIAFAGSQLVVTFACADSRQVVVFDEAGRPYVSLERGLTHVLSTGGHWVLLSEAPGNGAYLLDLANQRLQRLATPGLSGDQGAVVGSLLVWNVPGPQDSNTVMDVVYRVSRLG